MADPVKDLATSLIVVAPTTGTPTITVLPGEGDLFPSGGPFDVLMTANGPLATLATSEFARGTIAGDVITLTGRGLHGTTQRTVLPGWRVSAPLTAEMWTTLQAQVDANTTAVATNAAGITANTAAITAEATSRAAADTAEATARASAVTAEATARANADALLIPLSQKGAANGVVQASATGGIRLADIPAGPFEFIGVWNATTNTPTLVDGTGRVGDVYRVSVAGTQNLGSGSVTYAVNDDVVLDSGSVWRKIGGSAVAAVPPLVVVAPVTANGALAVGKHTPLDSTAGALAMTLPTGAASGSQISVSRHDATTNVPSVTGSIRGVGGVVATLPLGQHETIVFVADSAGSWWPFASHKTLATLDVRYVKADGSNLPASVVSRNVITGGNQAGSYPLALTMKDAWVTATLTGNVVFAPTASGPWSVVFIGTQDNAGGHTFSVSDGTSTVAVPVTTTAGAVFAVTLYSPNGTDIDVAAGATGPPGVAGNTVLTTSGAPASGTGSNGDYAYDPTAKLMYGPKASGAWPAGVSLVGPTGATGPVAPSATAAWAPTGGTPNYSRVGNSIAALSTSLVSGRLQVAGGFLLLAGVTYTSLSFMANTAVVSPLNQWFCLVDQSRNVIVKTVDDTTTAWGANTIKTLAFSAPYTPVANIAVYGGIVVVATTPPQLDGVTVNAAVMALTPIITGSSTTGLTNPASLGATAAAITSSTIHPWCYLL